MPGAWAGRDLLARATDTVNMRLSTRVERTERTREQADLEALVNDVAPGCSDATRRRLLVRIARMHPLVHQLVATDFRDRVTLAELASASVLSADELELRYTAILARG